MDLMKFNASSSLRKEDPIVTTESCRIWKSIAEKLWSLLDDIDTAGDLFKPPTNNFFKYVTKKSLERHKYLKSDGYSLKLTIQCLKNLNSDKA